MTINHRYFLEKGRGHGRVTPENFKITWRICALSRALVVKQFLTGAHTPGIVSET